METFYYGMFAIMALICGYSEFQNQKPKQSNQAISSSVFIAFRNNYLVVYSLMMAGDWLQGPYVYALYQHYGYGVGDIGKLFIAGFGSSMVFGTVVGSMADKYGRKKAGLCYVVTYILSCITKHWSDYYVLMLGRFFGGIATSLLFSAFESWLVSEHFKRGYEADWLGGTFSKAIFLGNGLVAILSGFVANSLVGNLQLGPVAPFDAAATFLAIGGAIIMVTWTENYGDSNAQGGSMVQQFKDASAAIAADKKIALLGAMQSLFEGAMYTFVFLWTPALSPNNEDIPHGFIFAIFMMASMVGSSIAGRLMSTQGLRVEKYMQNVYLAGAVALFIPVVVKMLGLHKSDVPAGAQGNHGISWAGQVQMVGFVGFEVCVGIFWPSIMKMRSMYVPEEMRSTLMNFFRMPLNAFVCIVLYNVAAFPLEAMFLMCTLFLLGAWFCQVTLDKITAGGASMAKDDSA